MTHMKHHVVLIGTALGVALTAGISPGQGQTGEASATTSVRLAEIKHPPVPADIRVGKQVKTLTIVGRKKDSLIFTDSDTGVGTRLALDIKRIESVEFALDYEPGDAYRMVRQEKWNGAVKILLPVLKPTFPYLDLVQNNAVEPALELGTYMMNGAAKRRRLSDSEEQLALVKRQYTSAYTVLKYVAAADWSPLSEIAALKRLICLLELQKPKTAAKFLKRLNVPEVGDAAYGLYWLVQARVHVEHGDFRGAMAAAVNSVCFENKDVETFPDALLITAQCNEELQNWYRARDIYYEIARIFPKTEWAKIAERRLRFIMKKGFTKEEEASSIANVFFGLDEDVNELVEIMLEKQEIVPKSTVEKIADDEDEIDLETAE